MNNNLRINDVYLRNEIVNEWIWHEYAYELSIKVQIESGNKVGQILGYDRIP